VQAATGIVPVDPTKDPTALMSGWSDFAHKVEDIARQQQATYVLTSGYALTSLLSVYAPATPVIQFNERLRWLSFDQPRTSLFVGSGLYVTEANKDMSGDLARRFAEVKRVGSVARMRGDKVINLYAVYRLAAPVSSVLNKVGVEPTSLNEPGRGPTNGSAP
jgi:hypothetical protein